MEASDEPATKADVQALSEMLGMLNTRLGWVWWFSLGALATSLWLFTLATSLYRH
jgi:hypothetical protein